MAAGRRRWSSANQVWIQRADTDPRYEGFKAGIILQTEAGLERRQGAFYIDGETLLGGWCEVMVRGGSRPELRWP